MDYALEHISSDLKEDVRESFNPCFSGLCFGTFLGLVFHRFWSCFNPCFSGLCFGTILVMIA